MNKKAMEGLKKEEELKSEIRDACSHIKDLEAELEWMHSREPHEVEYIARLQKVLDEQYAITTKLDVEFLATKGIK
tara:strand:- start:22821 stop:23048 length:228 start_codon:yes stop_codon:yes gene_type:complete